MSPLRFSPGRWDAAQEALVKAWRAFPGLKDERYFETWLVRIQSNECCGMLRVRAKNPSGESPGSLPAPDPPDPALRDALDMEDCSPVQVLLIRQGYEYVESGYNMDEVSREEAQPLLSAGDAPKAAVTGFQHTFKLAQKADRTLAKLPVTIERIRLVYESDNTEKEEALPPPASRSGSTRTPAAC